MDPHWMDPTSSHLYWLIVCYYTNSDWHQTWCVYMQYYFPLFSSMYLKLRLFSLVSNGGSHTNIIFCFLFFLYERALSKQRKYLFMHIWQSWFWWPLCDGFIRGFSTGILSNTPSGMVSRHLYALIIFSSILFYRHLPLMVVCFIMQCACHFRFLEG